LERGDSDHVKCTMTRFSSKDLSKTTKSNYSGLDLNLARSEHNTLTIHQTVPMFLILCSILI